MASDHPNPDQGVSAFLTLRETNADTEPIGLYATEEAAVSKARKHLATHQPEVWRVYVRRFFYGRPADVVFAEEAGQTAQA